MKLGTVLAGKHQVEFGSGLGSAAEITADEGENEIGELKTRLDAVFEIVLVGIAFQSSDGFKSSAEFKREYIGDMPTEMFLHFFKSLSDAARMNLNIKAEGDNEHHKIEGIFKALAKSIKMAVRRDIYKFQLPSTKGVL